VSALAAGKFLHAFDAFCASLGDDVGGTELDTEAGAVLVPAHEDDPFGAELLGRQHRQQSGRAVTDDRHGGAAS
jgi:hypothetical protein